MTTAAITPAKDLNRRSPAESKPSADATRCSRCKGLMVVDQCVDAMGDAGHLDFQARRCVQCGEVIDPVIQENRRVQLKKSLA